MDSLFKLENLPIVSGRYFETLIKPDFIHIPGAINGPMWVTEDWPFQWANLQLQFDATILEPIHFQVGTILEKNALENSLFVLVL